MNFKPLIILLMATLSNALVAENLMEEVVVVGTRSEKLILLNPYSIDVITSERIASNTQAQLADLLALSPSITLSDAGQAGQKRIRIRGEEAKRMALLVDGQEFGDHREVGVPLLVDVSRIRRIEIIRGPASVLYGPKAMGGVINVITKPVSSSKLASTLSATYNSSTSGKNIGGNFEGSAGDLIWNFGGFVNDQGLRRTPDELVENTKYDSNGYHGGFDYAMGAHTFGLAYEAFASNSEIYVDPALRFTPPFEDFAISAPVRDRQKVRLDYEYLSNTNSSRLMSVKFDAYQQYSQREFNTYLSFRAAPVVLLDTSIDTSSELVSTGINLQSDWDLSDSTSLIAGLQWVDDEIDQDRKRQVETNGRVTSEAKNNDLATLRTAAIYVQSDTSITDKIDLLVGFRTYNISGELGSSNRSNREIRFSDQHDIASLAMVYQLADTSTIRFNASQGYIYPSLLNLTMGAFAGSRYINPNPNLKPETSITYELGYRLNMQPVTLDVTAFSTQADNYIDHVTCNLGDACLGVRDKIYKNIGSANTHGIELVMRYSYDALELYSQVTWLQRNKVYESVDTWDAEVPTLTGRFGFRYDMMLSDKRLQIGMIARFENQTEELVSTRRGFKIESNAGYMVLDANISYKPTDHLGLYLSLDNLGNKVYHAATENLFAAARHARLKLSYSF